MGGPKPGCLALLRTPFKFPGERGENMVNTVSGRPDFPWYAKLAPLDLLKLEPGNPAKRLVVFSLLESLRTTLDRQSIVSLNNGYAMTVNKSSVVG